MNDPAHPIGARPMAAASTGVVYDEDLYGWATEQAGLLRAGKVALVDWANIAEELEDMARNKYRALESALRVLLIHLLKWEAQPAFRSMSWLLTIREQGKRFTELLADNPGLKQHLEEMRADAHASARNLATAETGLGLDSFPVEPLGWNVIHNPPAHQDDIPRR